MRVSAAGKETFRQGKTGRLPRLRRVAFCPRLGHESPPKWNFQPDAGGASQNEFSYPVLAECVISRILDKQAAEISFRSEVAVGDATVHRGVIPLGALQIVITLVADVAEVGNAHTRGLGEQGNLVVADCFRYVIRLDPPVGQTVSHDTGLADR